eukprot:TRINITY_DN92_c0_g1_i1.p1 TRINITY_DN92_c0_g1~~TRINITY_DN92_c0_g1_i1.p1  ORF type:complete len:860 (+),score=217.89 TRINITY_DN92_c0_g1_i1:181-2580(+)
MNAATSAAPWNSREKSGILEIFGESGNGVFGNAVKWKKRYCVVGDRHLYLYSKKNRTKEVDSVDLFGCNVKPYQSKKKANCFQLVHMTRMDVILSAASPTEMDEWVKTIQEEINASKLSSSMEHLKNSNAEIQEKDLEWSSEVVGKGGSGIIKKGMWLKSVPVAIKSLNNLPEFIDELELEGFYREMAILSEMRHPNVVSMFGFCRKESYICLVTEYIKGGDLSSCLKDLSKLLPESLKVDIALNIAAAMIYLHGRSLIHRDLKPGNILVESWDEGRVKVCDFGLSKIKATDTTMTVNMFGSPAYAAPELNKPTHTNKVDTFSFAVILWEIDTRKRAWEELESSWDITDAINKGERLPMDDSSVFKSLISKCWTAEPEMRPEFIDIYAELQEVKLMTNVRNVSLSPTPANAPPKRAISLSGSNLTMPAPSVIPAASVSSSNLNNGTYGKIPAVKPLPGPPKGSQPPPSRPQPREENAYQHVGLSLPSFPANSRQNPDAGYQGVNTLPSFPAERQVPAERQTPASPPRPVVPTRVLRNPSGNHLNRPPISNSAPSPAPAFSPSPPTMTIYASPAMVTQTGDKILMSKFTKAVMDWTSFTVLYADVLSARSSDLEKLKTILADSTEMVQRTTVNNFLKWFSPLLPENAGKSDTPGWTTSQIARVVGINSFHGWLSAEDCKEMLGTSAEGTFLFRFSQTPGCYSLSVMHLGTITHWRITSQKDSSATQATFKIDSQFYKSIDDIISYHMKTPLKVFQLMSTGKEDVYLTRELPVITQESNYANAPGAMLQHGYGALPLPKRM